MDDGMNEVEMLLSIIVEWKDECFFWDLRFEIFWSNESIRQTTMKHETKNENNKKFLTDHGHKAAPITDSC